MEDKSYVRTFRRYDNARVEYAGLLEEIRKFLANFTGELNAEEAPFVLRNLAEMEGLRLQRDDAYERFHRLEQTVFDQLGAQWNYSRDSDEG